MTNSDSDSTDTEDTEEAALYPEVKTLAGNCLDPKTEQMSNTPTQVSQDNEVDSEDDDESFRLILLI